MKAWFEDLPLDFTRMETRTAERLLIAGFPINMAAVTLAQDAGLDLALLNQMAPVKFLVRDMLVKARQSDRLTQLLAEVLRDPAQEAIHPELRALVAGYEGTIAAAAMRRKPSLGALAMLPSSIEVLGAGDAGPQPLATPGLEKIINVAAGFADPALFRLRLAEAEVRTARIDIGGKAKGQRIPDRGQSPAHELACRQRRRRGRCRCVRQQGLSSRKGRTGSRTRCGVCIELVGCTQRA